MATAAELTTRVVIVEREEETVTVTLSKREAALLSALSGYIPFRSSSGIQGELYDTLKVAGKAFAEFYLGSRVKNSPTIEFDSDC